MTRNRKSYRTRDRDKTRMNEKSLDCEGGLQQHTETRSRFYNYVRIPVEFVYQWMYWIYSGFTGYIGGWLPQSGYMPCSQQDNVKANQKVKEREDAWKGDLDERQLKIELERYGDENEQLIKTRLDMSSQIRRLQNENASLRKQKDDALRRDFDERQLKIDLERYEDENKQLIKTRLDMSNQIIRLQDENASLRKQKDDALRRLSEAVSIRLRDNNPNIVDLNDPFRPTKLAEMFSELYDNEWTAAYTVLDGKFTEIQIVIILLDIVMEAYAYCKLQTEALWKVITDWFLVSNRPESQQTSKLLKDNRKVMVPSKVAEMHEAFGILLTNICEDKIVEKFLLNNATMQDYSRKCVELCLLMVTTDPPVILGCPFWTPSAACKSMCAEKQVNTETRNEADDETRKVMQDIGKSEPNGNQANQADLISVNEGDAEISLGAKIPKHLSGNDTPSENDEANDKRVYNGDKIKQKEIVTNEGLEIERHIFDKNVFKEYTSRGQYLDFIVWPAMYLHTDGPLLSKGISQCSKMKYRDSGDEKWTWRRLHKERSHVMCST